ncbi:MAG: hypothetical protein SPF96_10860 [Prevotella sp.]|nr:hypothetical protein [Prevotella sp.]
MTGTNNIKRNDGSCDLSAISFTYPLMQHIENIGAANQDHWCSKSKSLVQHIEIIGAANQDHWCSKPIL